MNVIRIACLFACANFLELPNVAVAQTSSNVDFPSLTCITKQKANDTCSSVTVHAKLYMPAKATTALVVISHGSQGVDARHKSYAEALNSMGIAGLVIDHWGSRGIKDIFSDYEKNWSKGMHSLNQAFDALQAAKVFAARGFIKFGYMGESQGGNAVLWADKMWFRSEYRRVFHAQDPQFNALVALYPGCFERSYADKYTDSPLLIISGEADNNTPAALCRNYVNWVISREGDAEFIGLPGQHHDFDAPYYVTKTSAQNPSRCASSLDRTTRTWDETGEVFPQTSAGNAAFWKKCFQASANTTMVGGNSGNPKMGYKEWMAFFQTKLSN